MSKEYFQEIAGNWDDMQQSFFSEKIREKAFKLAEISVGETVADIGAGTGYLTEGLLSHGLNVIAIDQSENMLQKLAQKFGDENRKKTLLTCKVGDAENLPLQDESVDSTFANMYLHHVEVPQNAIKEMARVTKSGGNVVITDLDTHEYDFLEAEHYDRWKGFDRSDLRTWYEKAGLRNIQVLSTEEQCSSESSSGETASITVFVAIGVKN